MPRVQKTRALGATARNDTLDTTADNQILRGLAGNDVLGSSHNGTRLFGDDGKDRLTSTLRLENAGTSGPLKITLFQDGGLGNDILTVSASVYWGAPSDSDVTVLGGGGNDRIVVTNVAYGSEVWGPNGPASDFGARAVTRVDGGDGNDTIRVSSDTDGGSVSRTENTIAGGNGNDRIYVSIGEGIWGRAGIDTHATNTVDGGAGHDTIKALAYVNANGGYLAKNVVSAGAGNDTITADASASSNDSLPRAENRIDAGAGNDSVEASTTAGYGFGTIRVAIVGGLGNDRISSTAAGGTYGTDARVKIEGGDGDDVIDASFEIDGTGAYYASKLTQTLSGDDGNDTITAAITGPNPMAMQEFGISVVNRLDGDAGDDVLDASIEDTGRSLLDGGRGNDVLRVDGGARNALAGGSGHDRLFAGSGTDWMTGGSGRDDYVFDTLVDQATDTLVDFDMEDDRLCFIGVADRGTAGLADDIDAISTIVDEGAGLDVRITFDSGSVLVFEGAGLGTEFMNTPRIDSIADLVDDPAAQLRVELI